MIAKELISPESIVVVGASDDTSKPGGNALKNLLDTGYSGTLYAVNPKNDFVQGVKSYRSVDDLPHVDCAILAIPAKSAPSAVEILCRDKGCKGIVIFSAGFHEDGPEGAALERQLVGTVDKYGASMIGPNCIGIITNFYAGVFTKPVSNLSPDGIDIVSGSGATVVFIMEAAVKRGLNFSQVFSVGNSAQIGVEDVLEYLDDTYVPGKSSPVKLMYIENISNPKKLLKHARSLISKGARIAAIKAGYSDAGSRAASSHTGALATPDKAVTALFEKAGIIRVYSRTELVNMASVFSMPAPKGNNIAIITHAGGPAVMLTDVLSSNGINIPHLSGEKADRLLSKLYPGSSVANPIDFLATGTKEQLGHIIDACNNDFDQIDGMAVIFGSPGLVDVSDVYQFVLQKMKDSPKPIYPILTSVVNAGEAIGKFQQMGGICFTEEVDFGRSFANMVKDNMTDDDYIHRDIDVLAIRSVVDSSSDGYLSPANVQKLLDAAGIGRALEFVVSTPEEALAAAEKTGYPLVMKVVGPVHKTDVGGVVLNVNANSQLLAEFDRLMKIKDTVAVMLQPMLCGTEIFIGAKKEGDFGTLVLCGLGGIFVEALNDVSSHLAPFSTEIAHSMIKRLRGYKIIKGIRGLEGVNEGMLADMVSRVSSLCAIAPEIEEMDLNPILGNSISVTAVDARIRIGK
ncbi:MAG: CoA-binding protein [Bacteroidales bacterium]|nr:CoA-binding protein [Bacteroidales bacterium]